MGALQFWTVATFMVVASTAVLVVPLFWRARAGVAASADTAPSALAKRRWSALSVAAAVPLVALAIYWLLGSPELAVTPPVPSPADDVATLHARAAMLGGGGEVGGDLDTATARLRARLANEPGDTDGWRLLAQSYEFQGRTAEAAEAYKHAETPGAATRASPVATSNHDADSVRLAGEAEQLRRERKFAQAVTTYAELARRGGMSADRWADYADALGGARGRLDEDAAKCIDAALRIDPDHAKALWLRASWQTQENDHAAAIVTWQRLAAVLPSDSPDARIIAANLAEARDKSTTRNTNQRTKIASAVTPASSIALHGSVRLDPKLKARVAAGDVLFVFARAADERGPPLAVWRTTTDKWPLDFRLDDSNAMLPDRKLSDFARVILEARISRSGNALAQPGDLRAVSAVLNPRAAPPQQLMITEEVGSASVAKGS